ncbi:MAG: hypothetical protein LBC77_00080 [Spirochaetaceae bacterium]|jgi:hypothetical protein|nr:hypothetical protein [Spirochaetaceae bacterium]
MYAVNGYYTGGDTVKIERNDVSVSAPYKVVVTFIEPAAVYEGSVRAGEELAKSREAFARLSKYHKSLPADFDYKKELAEYREERFGGPGRH